MNLISFTFILLICSTAVLAHPKTNQNSGMPGGVTSVDPNSAEINELARKLVNKLDADSGSNCKQKVSRVFNASTQVVAGVKTVMSLEICSETCTDRAVNESECKVCQATVWEKSWENFFQVTAFSCP